MARSRRLALTLAVLGAFGLAHLAGKGEEASCEEAKDPTSQPTPQVLQALRMLLSSDMKEQERGDAALRRMGASIAPQLRYWVRKARGEAERVRVVLEALEGRVSGDPSTASITADEFFHRKLIECRELFRKGEHKKASDLANSLIVIDKNSPFAWELRRLARQANERIVTRETLEPGLETDKLVYEVGDQPEITFRLSNHKDSEVTIHVEKGILGEVDVTRTLRLMDGGMRLHRDKLRIQVPPEVRRIVIGPGKLWEHRLRFDVKEQIPLAGAMVRVQIEGRFRPSEWRVDGNQDNLGLSLNETEFWIVPTGQSPQCERPLDKLTAALVFKKLEPFFVGGQLCVWAGEHDSYFNGRFVETLLTNLEDFDPARLALAARFLNEATGQQLEAKPDVWKAWWARTKG